MKKRKDLLIGFLLGMGFLLLVSNTDPNLVPVGEMTSDECKPYTEFFLEGSRTAWFTDYCGLYKINTSFPFYVNLERYDCIDWGDYYDTNGILHREIELRPRSLCK